MRVSAMVSFLFLLLANAPCLYCTAQGLDSFSTLVRNLKTSYPDWSPRAILDIGANAGTWSTNVRKEYPDSKILMLEASDQHITALEATVANIGNAKYRIAVMSANDGDVIPFYFNPKANTGNSMFQEQTSFFSNIKPVEKISIKLDTLVEEEATSGGTEAFLRGNQDVFDVIKVDVQGAELMVLSGGLDTLQKATFVQFEGSTVEYNSGGSCFYDMDEFLRSKGFYLYDHADDLRHPLLFKTQGLGQWDVIYVNPDSQNLPHQLKSKGPNFCGSSPEKKKKLLESIRRVRTGRLSERNTIDYVSFCLGLALGLIGVLGIVAFRKWNTRKNGIRAMPSARRQTHMVMFAMGVGFGCGMTLAGIISVHLNL